MDPPDTDDIVVTRPLSPASTRYRSVPSPQAAARYPPPETAIPIRGGPSLGSDSAAFTGDPAMIPYEARLSPRVWSAKRAVDGHQRTPAGPPDMARPPISEPPRGARGRGDSSTLRPSRRLGRTVEPSQGRAQHSLGSLY